MDLTATILDVESDLATDADTLRRLGYVGAAFLIDAARRSIQEQLQIQAAQARLVTRSR